MRVIGTLFATSTGLELLEIDHGQTPPHRRTLEADRALATPTQTAPPPLPRPQAHRRPQSPDRHPLRSENRHQLGGPASGDGLRLRHDLLEEAPRLEPGRGLAEAPRDAAGRAARGGQDRLGAGSDRQQLRARPRRWRTGPSPVDRRKRGSKHQIITDAGGIPLVADTTAANVPDVNPMIPLVDAIPPVRGKPGRPRRRPASLYGDRGYDSDPHRRKLRRRGIRPYIARRRTPHGSGLGTYRWYVERTLSWLHNFGRLRVRKDKTPEFHLAFLKLACAMICLRLLCRGSFC